MEELSNRKLYGQEMATMIEALGPLAVSVANRWETGWRARVAALVKSGAYLDCLENQVDQEKDVLANEANLRHLTRREILQMYEIKESPPFIENRR